MAREKTTRLVITFYTTAEAMATERRCAQRGLPGKLISAPRALSADCGIAWSAPPETAQALKTALEDAPEIEFAGWHEVLL